PRVLYYNVTAPLIRISLVEEGHLLMHSACVKKNGRAYAIVAMPDTGKTSTVVSLCSHGGFEFMDDDMTIVTPDGTCLAFPKDLTLSMRLTRYVRPDSVLWPLKLGVYSGRVRRMVKRLSGSGGSLVFANVVTQSFFPPPKARLAIPETRSGGLGGIFCLERG